MKLPAHVLTKLSLAGAVGAVAAIATCEPAQQPASEPCVVEYEVAPVSEVEVAPDPSPAIRFAKPPPPKPAKPQRAPRQVSAHACGPCGMG